MTLKLYSIRDLKEPHDFRWYKSADYSFVERILKEKVPDSELIIVNDSKDIAQIINNSLPKLREKIDINRDRHIHRYKDMNPTEEELIDRARDFERFYEDRISQETEIGGIFFPARHGDWNHDMDQILENIGEPFKKGLERRTKRVEEDKHIYYPFSDVNMMQKYGRKFNVSQEELKSFMFEAFTPDAYIHERNKARGKYFFEKFNIPVFETWKFLPGYRLENEQIGKEEEKMCDRMHYVEYAYSRWLDINFKNKKDELPF